MSSPISDGWLNWICQSAASDVEQLGGTGDGAGRSSDRYLTSCRDGNCVDQCKWDAIWWLQQHGNYLRDLAGWSWMLGYYCDNVAGCDPSWGDYFRQQDDALDPVGADEEGAN